MSVTLEWPDQLTTSAITFEVDDAALSDAMREVGSAPSVHTGFPCMTKERIDELYAILAMEVVGLPQDDFAATQLWFNTAQSEEKTEKPPKPQSFVFLVSLGKLLAHHYSGALRSFLCDRSDVSTRNKCFDRIASGSGISVLIAGFVALGLSQSAAGLLATIVMALMVIPTREAICEQWANTMKSK